MIKPPKGWDTFTPDYPPSPSSERESMSHMVDQIERLAKALAKCTAERDEAQDANWQHLNDRITVTVELDAARAELAKVTAERDSLFPLAYLDPMNRFTLWKDRAWEAEQDKRDARTALAKCEAERDEAAAACRAMTQTLVKTEQALARAMPGQPWHGVREAAATVADMALDNGRRRAALAKCEATQYEKQRAAWLAGFVRGHTTATHRGPMEPYWFWDKSDTKRALDGAGEGGNV